MRLFIAASIHDSGRFCATKRARISLPTKKEPPDASGQPLFPFIWNNAYAACQWQEYRRFLSIVKVLFLLILAVLLILLLVLLLILLVLRLIVLLVFLIALVVLLLIVHFISPLSSNLLFSIAIKIYMRGANTFGKLY